MSFKFGELTLWAIKVLLLVGPKELALAVLNIPVQAAIFGSSI
ncbi:hypothetical protein [Nostoc sp.]